MSVILEKTEAVFEKCDYSSVQCYYCACKRDRLVASELNRLQKVTAISAVKLKKEWRQGAWQIIEKPLLPGYVFVYMHNENLTSAEFSILNTMKLLKYSDGSESLRGRDKKFADWLWEQRGIIGISKVLRCGDRVMVTDGPLVQIAGEITKVDWRKQIAKVSLDIIGGLNIWLSFDCVKMVEECSLATIDR